MKVHTVAIDEEHRLHADRSRDDMGFSPIVDLFATGAKRGIQLAISTQFLSGIRPEVLANLGLRIITFLSNPRCIWLAQQSMGLSPSQAKRITRLKEREVIVAYAGYPTPFVVTVNQLSFPPKPPRLLLERNAQDFLACVTWTEDSGKAFEATDQHIVVGDVLRVFDRICKEVETIEERCQALQMTRSREGKARDVLKAKGYIEVDKVAVGNKKILHGFTSKGEAAAEKMGIKVKRFKSGHAHEYILCRIEKKIGSLNTQYKFQRHSEIAREYGIQPDSVLNMTGGFRIIIEIVCTNIAREAEILGKEKTISAVDMILAITANKTLEKSLRRALEGNLFEGQTRLEILDAGTCLGPNFDWVSVFERP